MEQHSSIGLWMDRGTAGLACNMQALKSYSAYTDKSILYKDFDDLNEWLVQQRQQKQSKLKTIKLMQNGRH